jgi:hypothetical protein
MECMRTYNRRWRVGGTGLEEGVKGTRLVLCLGHASVPRYGEKTSSLESCLRILVPVGNLILMGHFWCQVVSVACQATLFLERK